jgi:tetratricopeptide (TPR) repeat protein
MKKYLLFILLPVFLIAVVALSVYFFYFKNKQQAFNYNDEASVFSVNIPDDFDSDRLQRLEEKKQQALNLYRTAKDDNWTWVVIGNYHEYAKDYSKAIKDYEKVLELNPGDIMALSNLAHIYEGQLQDYVKAEEFYQKSIQASPSNYQLYIDLALMYENKMQKPTLAVTTYLEGLKNNPDHPNLLIPLIRYYKKQGDMLETKKYAQMLLQKYPDNQQYLNEFGSLAQ